LQSGQRGCRRSVRKVNLREINADLLGAGGETIFSLRECGRYAAIALGIGNVAVKGIGAEN